MTEKIKVVLRGLSYQKNFPDFPEVHPGENQKPKQIYRNILFVYYFKDIYFSCNMKKKSENKMINFGGSGLYSESFCKKSLLNVEGSLNDENITDARNDNDISL